MNGVTVIEKPEGLDGTIAPSDGAMLLLAALAGHEMQSYPATWRASEQWELFNPNDVELPEELPAHWHVVYKEHCDVGGQELGYTYLHSPDPIRCRYPMMKCSGIFVRLSASGPIEPSNLVNINSELLG